MSTLPALVVFSHLRWDFVFQRPQHLMSRLATNYRVFFIEEPVYEDAAAHWEVSTPAPNVTVCRPHTGIDAMGFDRAQIPVLQGLIEMLIAQERLHDPIVWLYTPMALALSRSLRPRVLVYDCMDELSGFMNAPPELMERESALLRAADLVFTGGPSIFKSKQHRNAFVHCFSSSVDTAHFSRGAEPGLSHAAQAYIAGPRLGFYGVIDERMDLSLIDSVAAARPEWQLIMVGPVVKIDPASLPRRPNIHYLGQRQYDELPAFLAGWDVCLMPFALNSATRFISPTKTLEYMAAGKPIVTTAVTDVIVPYGHIVYTAHNPTEFIAGCEAALAASPDAVEKLGRQTRKILRNTSWDATAERMRELLEAAALPRRQRSAAPSGTWLTSSLASGSGSSAAQGTP